MTIDLIKATFEDFEPYVGEVFIADYEGGQIELTLDNVKVLSNLQPRDNYLEIEDVEYPARQPFSLTFEGPREPVLHARVYTLSNEKIGNLELFVSGFRQDHQCMLYESSFS